jgi:hypothetical protein
MYGQIVVRICQKEYLLDLVNIIPLAPSAWTLEPLALDAPNSQMGDRAPARERLLRQAFRELAYFPISTMEALICLSSWNDHNWGRLSDEALINRFLKELPKLKKYCDKLFDH